MKQFAAIKKPEDDWTIYTAEEIWKQASCWLEESTALTLDLSQVGDIDTSGVQVLAMLDRHCREGGGRLAIVNGSQPVQAVLELYGVSGEWVGESDGS